jgi:Flp pilus assembly protein TadD
MKLNQKGIALGNQGKYDEALKAFDEAIRIDPKLAGAWNNKGVLLDVLGRTSEANVAKAKAKELGYSG